VGLSFPLRCFPRSTIYSANVSAWRRRPLSTRASSTALFIADLHPQHYSRILELNRKYKSLRLGFVDAAVLALAEHLGLGRVATTDRRHFGAVEIAVSLELVPDKP
jgi:predicted nucleic acid-binding protein